MNLFYLSRDVSECARWHCDKHVVKMILELVQMLYTAWHLNVFDTNTIETSAPFCKSTGTRGYKKISNHNHPMAKWVRETRGNYIFTVQLAAALCLEFNHRYDHYHSCTDHVLWLSANIPTGSNRRTEIPQCMPDEYKVPGNPIQAYRNYYDGDKRRFAKWKRRPEPPWW